MITRLLLAQDLKEICGATPSIYNVAYETGLTLFHTDSSTNNYPLPKVFSIENQLRLCKLT
jgi:hypothetical protein